MKKIILTSLIILFKLIASAQNNGIYELYNHQQYFINPAAAGEYEKAIIGFSMSNYDWNYSQNYPETYSLYGFSNIKNDTFTVGCNFFYEKTNILKTKGGAGTFAFHLPLKNNKFISLGTTIYILNKFIDAHYMYLGDAISDPHYFTSIPQNDANADIGVKLHNKSWYIGASVIHIFNTTTRFNEYIIQHNKRKYYGILGYKFSPNSTFILEPTLVFRYDNSFQLDIQLKAYYNNKFYVGASYNINNPNNINHIISAIIGLKFDRFLVGFIIKNNLSAYWSSPYTIKNEIMIKVDLFKPNETQYN